ncbi:sigma-54 interaction domain-containing protein [Neobacillus drentensis]|uniref:sigma-54 interaction domain-containing protein n=1 Tax=Neobacillus drentensis TaxID=220684 RepID=UPI00286215D3|nr:sigma 54-interacting transcriptional regulator [Neobacillus drentensis]MDR7236464.1 transcriptional regulator with PAS, ATPase and Fis domain [Neobacillus drentensis]
MIMTNDQLLQAFQSSFLSIYDEMIVTNGKGTILFLGGKLKNFWSTTTTPMIGRTFTELEEISFFGDPILQLLNNEVHSLQLKAWNGSTILITVFQSKGTREELMVWGLKSISDRLRGFIEITDEPEIKHTPSMVVHSQKMKDVLHTIEMVSKVSTTVLLLGESGVGKEMFAKTIHQLGNRKSKPFIAVNCGAIPENLLESELFGYVGGAFSGANKNGAPGKFELANEGIIFLDEIAELPLKLQVKLLRILQEKEVTPLGSSKPIHIDVQIIAATNQSLEKMVREGRFREDLYYRLNVVPIEIPSLRERTEEIPYLIYHFVGKYNTLYHRNINILPDAIDLLSIYDWPGNVRQLENTIERIVVTSKELNVDSSLVYKYIPKQAAVKEPPMIHHIMPLQEAVDLIEEQLIQMAIDKYKSVKLAAKVLDISQPTMSRKYKKIREKIQHKTLSPLNKRKILEEHLNKQLRSMAIVTSTVILPEEIFELVSHSMSPSSLTYKNVQKKLTKIREQEGIIEWVYIFKVLDNNKMLTIVASEDFVIPPGHIYEGPPEMIEVALEAMDGKAGVTSLYEDVYGEWKTSFAPLTDHNGNVLAIIGFDHSRSYIENELKKIGDM